MPTLKTSVAGIDAVNVVEFKKVVERSFPLKRTTEPTVKLVPCTVNVKPSVPALMVAGERPVIPGTTGKLTALEVPPPGFLLNTVINKLPCLMISFAGIKAVNCVELTKVVVRLLPLTRTTELETNRLPLTVSVKLAPPMGASGGERLLMTGTGLVIPSVTELNFAPWIKG